MEPDRYTTVLVGVVNKPYDSTLIPEQSLPIKLITDLPGVNAPVRLPPTKPVERRRSIATSTLTDGEPYPH